MNKKIYLLPILLFVLALTSCEETKEVSKYDNWQSRNDAFIDSLQNVYATGELDVNHRKLERFEMLSAPGKYIYYKVLSPVTNIPNPNNPYEYIENYVSENMQPYYTDSVYVYYKGCFINRECFDSQFSGANPTVFDSPVKLGVSDLVMGMTECLQRIKVGERWEFYIPWKYAYGSSDYTNPNTSITIPGYSTLIFDMQLYGILNRSSNMLLRSIFSVDK